MYPIEGYCDRCERAKTGCKHCPIEYDIEEYEEED